MTEGRKQELAGWVIAALLSALITGGGAVWYSQRQEMALLRMELTAAIKTIGMLEGSDGMSQQDRAALHERLSVVERRQDHVIGVLATINPKATSAILAEK